MANDTGDFVTPPTGATDDKGLRDEILQQLEAQGVAEGEAGDPPQADQPATFRFSDGTEVPVEELEKGWLRQSDYTRKTQETSELRKEAEQALRLMQALAENPAETLEALQRNLAPADNDDQLDPLEAQIRDHDERFAQLEQERFDAELNQAMTALEQQYADRGFDRDAVLEYAVEHDIPNLRAAFLDMEEQRQIEQGRQQRNQEALGRKQALPPIGGRSRQLGGDAPSFIEVNTVADAMKNALAELEAS